MRSPTVSPDAETLGLKALTFLVNSGPDVARFLDSAGLEPADLRQRAGEWEFLTGVIDFLLANEALLARFCEAESVDARAVHSVRRTLSRSRR